ncbi:hypothetical protein CPU12_10010 [Malaciobacter molluscorum LMG 25693]|uniref:Phage tail collar protein n=1 Tax=Malaciobacter molluscorum LMG 25693 TaxID=870501 RepID=A0A2G1DGN7_9BACT|nr:tail fiber protein [Malaciobacter molluscorum]AXX93490.1 phage tail collar protein [Malaciobacter molluscorum LMG 25693]PHO17496.1 hypothetical protein CPU12_10010 [Malaciobacter molluscorum LMG 25693]
MAADNVVENLVDNVRLLLSSDTSLESLKEIDLCVKQNRVDLENIDSSKIIGLDEALDLKVNVSDIVDNLLSTLADAPLSANQGRVLAEKVKIVSEAIEAIKTVLASDDTTLDELQEIVNFIKQNKEDLSTLDLSNIAETNELKHFTKELKEKLENLPTKENLNQFTVPTGFILINPVATIPSGFLECNGSEVSREKYSELFKVIGTTYGGGDKTTTFNLPDLRGEFIRGFDNGRGVDKDRNIGNYQDEQLKNHTHTIRGNNSFLARYGKDGPFDAVSNYANASDAWYFPMDPSGGGTETRPRNVAMMYCIKY